MTSREDLHQAARRVVWEYENEGIPFILYLRKFDIHVLHGKDDLNRYLLENYILDNLPQGVNLITVQEDDPPSVSNPQERIDSLSYIEGTAFSRRAPALSLGDDQWPLIVGELIKRADIVVSECFMLSHGVNEELLLCHRHKKYDQTVLVLPSGQFAIIDDYEVVHNFPRGVWGWELNEVDLFDHFAIGDLLERIERIARLSKRERLSLVGSGASLSECPVTYDGVVSGYLSHVAVAELAEEDDDLWHYKFSSYFRALSILLLQVQRRQVEIKDVVYQMVDCYVKLGYLVLRAKKEGDTTVITADVAFARQCASSAYRLASDYGAFPYTKLAEDLYAEIDTVETAIEYNRDNDAVVVRSPVKNILTRKGTSSDFT
jgi:hypothetical protein